ncbi:hypothetical protein BWQ96_09788 [Gracilariopsis chorda]|uniref:VanZ-like domain-containing protein n=1 Tax=Gracilariopsis chorda TaxID=448386 RepID=A0A2V3IEK8_9FLOR|nr:hypothetical protein BWQ96_09788 [Gracilariopsis chorda]|eukprot:PXF40507.1 hypothetical protein BWQ96_09788 [Gracilariopsis chorda]
MRRQISYALLLLTAVLLILGTLTPVFASVLPHLPPHSDIVFHFFAHVVLVLALAAALPSLPREAACAYSVAAAVLLELAQAVFVRSRNAHLPDIIAATLASFAVFLVPREGKIRPPSAAVFLNWLIPDEDDDDLDSHRVTSWAV